MSDFAETDLFHSAIDYWWKSKSGTKARNPQGGTRDANLHGKTMDGFSATIREFLIGLNVKTEDIYFGGQMTTRSAILPSYFRPSKNWDLIVLANSRFYSSEKKTGSPVLYAVIEFKSQDKSIGNNQNNRLEESLGSAVDFWTTYAHSGFERQQPRPWLGYLFVGNYSAASDSQPVKIKQPHFLAMPPFRVKDSDDSPVYGGPSYSERYKIFLKQSVGARLYDAGAFIVTDEPMANCRPNHRLTLPEFGSGNFLRSLKGQILAHYPEAKVEPQSMASRI